MKKISYAQIQEQSAYYEKQHSLYMIALQYVMRGEAVLVTAQTAEDGDTYEYRACGETRADGGLQRLRSRNTCGNRVEVPGYDAANFGNTCTCPSTRGATGHVSETGWKLILNLDSRCRVR